MDYKEGRLMEETYKTKYLDRYGIPWKNLSKEEQDFYLKYSMEHPELIFSAKEWEIFKELPLEEKKKYFENKRFKRIVNRRINKNCFGRS